MGVVRFMTTLSNLYKKNNRIGEVPGGKIYQHYLRILYKDDINEEVLEFMKMALTAGI